MTRTDNNYNKKEVLVIGGAGFIGSNLAIKLLRSGAKVTVADIFHPSYGGNIRNFAGVLDDIVLHHTDLRDEFGIRRLVAEKDFIFNLAAQVSYTDSMMMPYLDLDINCRGHLLLLEICREVNPPCSVVFSSSRMVYGKTSKKLVTEDHPTNPLSLYATHKLTAEKYYLIYNHHYGLDTKIVRIANPYGYRNQMKHGKYGIVNWFLRLAMEDKTLKIFGDGSQIRDYIFIDDVVNGMLAVGALKAPRDMVFNLGSGIGTSFLEMAESICDVVGKGRIESVPWPEDYEKNETGDYVADITRLKEILGKDYEFVDFRTGLKETYKFYEENRSYYF